ncbi:MAG: MGMT family protein [Candidatus Pacebacteria bacterium]|nr:MGMT family protein [Candidatus Paceibacterota bacterium]
MTDFQNKVYDFVRKIPKGKVVTYKQVAKAIGRPKAYRAVGNALNKNPFSFEGGGDVPCHRVVRSDGAVGGFASGTNKKLQLLNKEGALK